MVTPQSPWQRAITTSGLTSMRNPPNLRRSTEANQALPIHVTTQMLPGYGGHIKFDCGHIQPFVHCQFTPAAVDVAPGGLAQSTLIVATDPTQWEGMDFEARATDGKVMKRKWIHIDLPMFAFYSPDGALLY